MKTLAHFGHFQANLQLCLGFPLSLKTSLLLRSCVEGSSHVVLRGVHCTVCLQRVRCVNRKTINFLAKTEYAFQVSE